MPISPMMTTRAITTGILFLSGGFASGCSGTVAGTFWLAPAWLPRFLGTVKLHLLFADGEIAVIQFLRDGVEAIAEIEVDKRWLLVLHLVESRVFS